MTDFSGNGVLETECWAKPSVAEICGVTEVIHKMVFKSPAGILEFEINFMKRKMLQASCFTVHTLYSHC